MNDLSVRDIVDLVASQVAEADQHIKQLFEWEHSRRLEVVKWELAAAAAFFVPVAVAFFKGEISETTPSWWLLAALFACVLFAITGFIQLYKMKRWQRNFIAAIKLLSQLQEISPFIRRYRNNIR